MTYIVKFDQEESGDKICEVCGVRIPKARLKVLPDTTTCVKCSKEKSRIGIMCDTAGNNSGMELQMSDPDNHYVRQSLRP